MPMKDEEEEEKENYVGRTVKKFFSGFGFFHGKVISFNRARSFYKVKYDDGDREELELKELKEIIVAKESVLSAERPRGRRGRKRRRESTDKDGTCEAGKPSVSEKSERDKIPGYNFVQGKVKAFSPVKVSEEVNVYKDMSRQLGNNNEAGEESDRQEDEHLLEPLIPISLVNVFEKSGNQLEPPADQHPCEERGKKRTTGEPGKPVPVDTTPPCRLKRTRVTPASESCPQQIPLVDHKNQMAETVKKMEDLTDILADVRLPCAAIEGDLCEMELKNNNLQSGTDRSGAFEKEEESQFVSSVLSLLPSSTSLGPLDQCVAELFEVYSLLRSFSNMIFLSPFSLEEFAFALNSKDVCSLIDCVHLSLLQTLRRQLERLSKNGSKSATFTLRLSDWSLLDYITWPSFLVAYLLTQGFNFDRGQSSVKESLSTVEYHKLPVRTKLTILSFLCDKVLETEEARAEIARRAILEHDPEMTDMKMCLQKGPVKGNTFLDLELEDQLPGVPCSRQGKAAAPVQAATGQETSAASAANSIKVGRHLDEDGNLDECVLCAMDGNLICCDGCPAAYHSRCVGVTKQGLPTGDWFCPECRADKQDQRGARISKGVRGCELLVVGPDGQLFFNSCGYLLISMPGAEGQAIHRYYSPRDLHRVLKFLEEAGPIYAQLHNAVQKFCEAETIITAPAPAGLKISTEDAPPSLVSCSEDEFGQNGKQCGSSQMGGEVPMEVDKSFSASDSVMGEQTNLLDLKPVSLSLTVTKCHISINSASNPLQEYERKPDLPVPDLSHVLNGRKQDVKAISSLTGEYEKKPYLCCDEPRKLVKGENHSHLTVESESGELGNVLLHASHDPSKQTTVESVTTPDKLQTIEDFGNGHVAQCFSSSSEGGLSAKPFSIQNVTTGSGGVEEGKTVGQGKLQPVCNSEWATNGACATPADLPAEQQLAEHKDVNACTAKRASVRTDKTGRHSEREEDYLATITQINACSYANKYANCDLVATAAFNLAVMTGGVDDLVDDKNGTMKKAKPSSVTDQLKAFTQASAHFFWPSSKKRAKDVPKEKCGWCINCRLKKRGCLLTQVAGQLAGGAAIVVGGIRPLKSGYGHFPAVAAYILYMEENLHGLLVGPWESPGHRKKWRKQVEQAKSLKEVKLALLQMESSLRKIALTSDWDKFEEDAPESIANSAAIMSTTGVLTGKKSSSRKRGRPPVITKSPGVISYHGACFGLSWWRGGSTSRQVYNWESLSRIAIKRAGRQGGYKEISDLVYSKSLDLPRRTRQFAWRTRLEKISTIAQVAVEVRHLDTFIKWNDIISPLEASTTHNMKGQAESDPAFWKAEIRAKSDESGTIKYLLGFPNDTDEITDTLTLQQQDVLQKGVGATVEKPTGKKQQAASKECSKDGSKEVWVGEGDVPLFLLKDFEVKTRATNHSKLPKSSTKKGKMKTASQLKKISFWKMLCTPRLAGVLESKKSLSWVCGYCQLTSESQSVKCQRCNGEFHRKCTQIEDSTNGREKVPVCKSCIKLRLGQRMRKPSYKMLVMQSQLADGSPVSSKEAGVSTNMEEASKGAVKIKRKKDTLTELAFQTQQELFGRKKKKSLRSLPTPSQLQSESTLMERKSSGKKKKKKRKGLITVIPSQHEGEPIEVRKKKSSKRKKTLIIAVGQPEAHQENLPQPKKGGRKKKMVSIVPIQYEGEEGTPQGRRTSGRVKNANSPNAVIPVLVPDHQIPRNGKRKSGYKLDKDLLQPLSAANHQQQSSTSTKRRPGRPKLNSAGAVAAAQHDEGMETENKPKRKRLKIIFSGRQVSSQDVNKDSRVQEGQKRKSGNGLDYGCRSARSEADIQRFRKERLILAGQVGLDQGNGPVCSLCPEKAYVPGHVYVSCEYCGEWFHGDAVGVKSGDAAFLVGFKCHRCRKCRAPSCHVVQNVGGKPRRRGAIDHGEVIDAENVNRSFDYESGSSLESSWLNSPDKEFSAFDDTKAFPDFVAATNQAEEALAADGSNFGHDVLCPDFDISDLVLPGDSQLQLNPLALEDEELNVWANNGSGHLDLPVFSGSQADLSSRAAQSLSFTELLSSEDDYFAGVAGSGLGLSTEWSGGMYGSGHLPASSKLIPADDAALDKSLFPLSGNHTTSHFSFPERNGENNSNMEECASVKVDKANDHQEVIKGKGLAAGSR